jgi:hypothetical protein
MLVTGYNAHWNNLTGGGQVHAYGGGTTRCAEHSRTHQHTQQNGLAYRLRWTGFIRGSSGALASSTMSPARASQCHSAAPAFLQGQAPTLKRRVVRRSRQNGLRHGRCRGTGGAGCAYQPSVAHQRC